MLGFAAVLRSYQIHPQVSRGDLCGFVEHILLAQVMLVGRHRERERKDEAEHAQQASHYRSDRTRCFLVLMRPVVATAYPEAGLACRQDQQCDAKIDGRDGHGSE